MAIGPAPLACNLNALNPSQRTRYEVLIGKLRTAARGVEELPAGYAVTVDPSELPVTELAEWVTLEARCCPFLDFGMDLRGMSGSVTLRLTGSKGVKALLADELGLGSAEAE